MRGSNAVREHLEKNEELVRNIGPIGLFSQKHWMDIDFKNSLFLMWPPDPGFSLMRPARHFEFETTALKYVKMRSI